jgi:LPXTG-motif cell wall-anchored protein
LKKVMLLAAVVAMVMAAAVPALAQTVTQIGDGNIACVQTAVQQNVVGNDSPQGNGNAQASQYGDNVIINNISNESVQAISQECNITIAQVNTVVNKYLTVNKMGEVVKYAKATASATASASAPAAVKYEYSASAPAAVKYEYSASAPAAVEYEYSASAPAAVEYEYSASASAAALPDTGGSSLIALGAGVLLVAGGLLARRIVR